MKKNSGYLKLLEEIKKKDNKLYKPKNYNFSLKDFDEKGRIKKKEN